LETLSYGFPKKPFLFFFKSLLPAPTNDRLNSTLERATYEMEMSRNRLENSNQYPAAGYAHGQFAQPVLSGAPTYAPAPVQHIDLQSVEKSADRKRVQIAEQDTPRYTRGPHTQGDNDIFNMSGGRRSATGNTAQGDYARELKQQMEAQKAKRRQQKAKDEAYDLKVEREAAGYDPFGRGGGGAPVTDKQGNRMADLRAMRALNNTVENNLDMVSHGPGNLRKRTNIF